MPHQPIELILARQFADTLNMAVFLVDPKGNLLFYNPPAEDILGMHFSETGSMAVEDWSTIFKPTDIQGNELPPEGLPLVQTLTSQKPAHGSFYINNQKGEKHLITVTAFAIVGRPDRYLGAMALFWKTKAS